MTRSLFLCLLTTSLLLVSCTKGNEPVPAPVYLLDQRWVLTELEGQPVVQQTNPAATDLLLNSVASTTGGHTFCSSYAGTYQLVAGSSQVRFATQASTRAACPHHNQEARYLALLPQVARYVITNCQLALYSASSAQPLLVFEAAK